MLIHTTFSKISVYRVYTNYKLLKTEIMKKLLEILREKTKKLSSFLQELANGASYAIHR